MSDTSHGATGGAPVSLPAFLVRMAAALNATDLPVEDVQQRIEAIGARNGAPGTRASAFPTFVMVTTADGGSVRLEVTPSRPGRAGRLDGISAIERLASDCVAAPVDPGDGLDRLDLIEQSPPRFGAIATVAGYVVLSVGICLVLRPTAAEVPVAAVGGGIVGVLRLLADRGPGRLEVLLPVVAAFAAAVASAVALRLDLADPGARAIVAPLVVFLPGGALTTSVVELAAGQVMSGASRLVAGILTLALLAFGILAGLRVSGIGTEVLAGTGDRLGEWAAWLGALVFTAAVSVTHSAPRRALPSLLVVLLLARTGQVLGAAALGPFLGAFVGSCVLVCAAAALSRVPSSMSPQATFLPGFWLLVPGSMGLIGLARWAGSSGLPGTADLLNTAGTIFAVAVGVLVGDQILAWIRGSLVLLRNERRSEA